MQNSDGLILYSLIKTANIEALDGFLVKTKIDLNTPIPSLQLLPIQVAFILNSHTALSTLIKRGANPNYKELDLLSPMLQSDEVWSTEMFRALLDNGLIVHGLRFYGGLARHPIVLAVDARHPAENTARVIEHTTMSLDEWTSVLYHVLRHEHGLAALVLHKMFALPFASPIDKRTHGLKVLKTLFMALSNITVETTVIHAVLSQFDFIFDDPAMFSAFNASHRSADNPFTLLPTELVTSILNQLSVSILLRLSRTCKALHYYTRHVTSFDTSFRSVYSSLPRKYLVHTNYDLKKAAQMLFLVNRFPRITSAFLGSILVFPYAAQRLIDKWWSNGIKSLTVRCLDRQRTLELFNSALTSSARLLERLDLHCFQRGHDVFVDTLKALNQLPNLKHVAIVSRHYRAPPALVEVSIANSSVQFMKLSGHHQFGNAMIHLTLDTPLLEHLALINTTQQVTLRHVEQLNTFKLTASEPHAIDLRALSHLQELKLVYPKPNVVSGLHFPNLRKLSVKLGDLPAWLQNCPPQLRELGLFYEEIEPMHLGLIWPVHLDTIDVHTEDTLLALSIPRVDSFKCTKFDFQEETDSSMFPEHMQHFWMRSCTIRALPSAMTDKDQSLLLPRTVKSLHIFKTSITCRIAIKQAPFISLIANFGSEVSINVSGISHLELIDNSNKITLYGDFAALRHIVLKRNTLIKINDEQATLNKGALLTFDVDILM